MEGSGTGNNEIACGSSAADASREDWIGFCKFLGKRQPPRSPTACGGDDVVEFLRLRRSSGSSEDLVGRLRAAFEENSGNPEENPFASPVVRRFLKEQQQIEANKEFLFEIRLSSGDVMLNFLTIPKRHGEKYFPPLDITDRLKRIPLLCDDEYGSTWWFGYSYRGYSLAFTMGWGNYVKAKNLRPGDVISFHRHREDGRFFISCIRHRDVTGEGASPSGIASLPATSGETLLASMPVFLHELGGEEGNHIPLEEKEVDLTVTFEKSISGSTNSSETQGSATQGDACTQLYAKASEKLVGMSLRLGSIFSILRRFQPLDVQTLGIWGMAGIGKTTLAREMYRKLASRYDLCYFLQDFDLKCRTEGLNHLRNVFFSKIFGEEKLPIDPCDTKLSFMRGMLLSKRVLVVLDDVTNARDAEDLVGGFGWFSGGHTIIFTSRNRQVLVQCKVKELYKMQELSESESFSLCSQYTTLQTWKATVLTAELVNYASGIPLAIRVFGSSLTMQHIDDGKKHLQRLQRYPPTVVWGAFRRSYDGLDDNEKSIFLDLACFFRGENKVQVVKILDGCCFFTDLGICGLIDEALISLLDNNNIEMPNAFQDMGRFVVCVENKDPGKRSRLWDAHDIADVLSKSSGTEAVEGIFLDASDLACELSPSVFDSMYRLRLLKFYCSTSENQCKLHLPRGLHSLPDELRLLHWENYPLKSLPRDFNPKNLVELNMPYSNMEKLWKGTKNLEKLKKIRLSHSRQLTKIPRLSKALNLEHIDLEGCTNLVKVSSSIHHLRRLVSLNLKDCTRLQSLPGMVHSESLQVLNLSGCSELENIQDFSPNLKELYLARTAIRELPSSIKNLTELAILDLEHCKSLRRLPKGMSNLKSLGTLKLSGCPNLESIQNLVASYPRGWQHFDLKKTIMEKSAPLVFHVPAIQESRLDGSENLLNSPTSLLRSEIHYRWLTNSPAYQYSPIKGSSRPHFQWAILSLCSLGKLPSTILYSLASRLYAVVSLSLYNSCLQDIPAEICCMPSLKALDLGGNGFRKLPESIKQLSKLHSLRLHRCKNLISLPELPRSTELLDVHGCTSLESIKWCFKQIPRLCIFSNCFDLSQEVVRELVAKALKSVEDMAREHQQELVESPAFSICVPTSVRGIPKTSTWTSSPIIIQPTSRRKTLLGFVLSVSVSLSDDYSTAAGFGIKCICSWRTKNGLSHRLERIFRFWEPRETALKLQRDHTFAFYDATLRPGDDIMDDRVEFELCPVDGQNMSLHDSCTVTQCGAYDATVLTGDTSLCTKRAASSMDPGALCDSEEEISRNKRVRLRRVIETIILEIRKRKRLQRYSFQNIAKVMI